MKPWQKIIGLVLTTGLILAFYIGSLLYKVAHRMAEGFQAGAVAGSAAASTDQFNPGPESGAEQQTFDLFEYLNQLIGQDTPTTPMEPYNPGAALAEFDDGAPVPWDHDNKMENPKDILWGYVDSRCSRELWTAAKNRALFNTASNIEIAPNGQLSYYSNWLNGKIFHDPKEIGGVKFAEFLLDFATEEIIEGVFDRVGKRVFGESIEALGRAQKAALADVAAKVAEARTTTATQAGRTLSRTERDTLYETAFTRRYGEVLKEIELREANAFGAGIGRFQSKLQILSRGANRVVESGFKYSGKAIGLVGKLVARSIGLLFKTIPEGATRQIISGARLAAFGEKSAARSLAKAAGKRASTLVRSVSQMMLATGLFAQIPIFGTVIALVLFTLNLFLLAIIPQILSILSDLDQSDKDNPCQASVQGCPPTHPYNIICAMRETLGSDTALQIVLSIPLIGDGIAAFGPYLCSTPDMSEIKFRQSFRAPPYYFDTTLSLYYTEKSKILDGGYDGCSAAHRMYTDAAEYRLKKSPQELGISEEDWVKKRFDEISGQYYHPWVDYAHPEMLDAMAAYYYDVAKRNQTYDIDGIASFQYIRNFKGVIASSQYSCDVQIQLTEVKYDPLTNIKLSETDVDDPNVADQTQYGCSFHDRRFYFTVDFTRCSVYNPASPTDGTLTTLEGLPAAQRLAEYRKMFVVVGCTNCNGTAPGIIDLAQGDGEFVGESPVGLGPLPGPDGPATYLPPVKYVRSAGDLVGSVPYSLEVLNNGIPNDVCDSSSAFTTAFGTVAERPRDSAAQPPPPPASYDPNTTLVLATEADFLPGLREDTPTQLRTRSPTNPMDIAKPRCNTFAELSLVTNPAQGDKAYVFNETKEYVFWNGSWQPYKPKPIWKSNTNPDNCERSTAAHYNGSTKMWRSFRIKPSEKQKWGQGAYGAFVGALPMMFGFEGGVLSTSLDVFGANAKAACTYMDANKQVGTFVVNGYVVTSQDHFFINRGPTIAFAPGYVPRYTKKCQSIPITQKVCASRYMIRSMNKRYMSDKAGTRRIRRITGILPNIAARTCVYLAQDIGLNTTDKTDIEGTETNVTVTATPYVADTSTCAFTWDPSKPFVYGRDSVVVDAIPVNASLIPPPLTNAEVADPSIVPKTEWEALAPSQQSALITRGQNDPAQAAKNTALRTTGPDFLRRGCTADYADCSKPAIRDKLIADFNAQYQKVDGDPSAGNYVRIASVNSAVTPMYKRMGYSSQVCILNANVEVEQPNPNGGAALRTTKQQNITMVLAPMTGDACKYTLQSHNFPVKYFFTPVPKTGWLELPPVGLPNNTNFKRASCNNPAFSDCSNNTQIERIVTDFNIRNPDRKILRIVRASTPAVPGMTPTKPFCDYQADIYKKIRSGASVYPYVERQQLRFRLKEATSASDPTGCLYDIDYEYPTGIRSSGTSIQKNTADQLLPYPFSWATGYAATIRNKINGVLATFVTQDIPGTLKAATSEMRDKLGNLQNTLGALTEVAGCTTGTGAYSCRNPDFVKAFIARYNFDNWPTYPAGQFGSYKRTVIGVRRAGLAGTNMCQIELIEKEESFVNFLKEPNPAPTNPTAESNKRYFLRQYQFRVNSASLVNSVCNFVIPPFTADDIKNRTFDISGAAYALDVASGPSVEFTPAQQEAVKPSLLATTGINPWATPVLDLVKTAVNAYSYGTPNFSRMELKRIFAAINVAPNIIEYGARLREVYRDPDFGLAAYDDEKVIITVRWNEPLWNPITGAFSTGGVPAPSSISVWNIGRTRVVNGTQLQSDGIMVDYAPYLFYTSMTTNMFFAVDIDPKTERTRVTRPTDQSITSYITPIDTGGWSMYSDPSSQPVAFVNTRLSVPL